MTIATRASPSASAIASSTSVAEAPLAAATIRRTRSWSFSFAATTSTMRFPYVFPSRIIEIVEIVLRTSFCAVPALSRVDPARNSGPTTTAISCSTRPPSSEPGAHTTHAVSAPAAPGGGERSEHVRRRAAGAHADDRVGGADVERLDVRCARVTVVLGGCLDERWCRLATCDERDDAAGRGGEGRLALRGVERRDPTGRAGADVDEPAAGAHALGDRVDRDRDR